VCGAAPLTVTAEVDAQIAAQAARDWLGEGVTLTPLAAMNSSTWLVTAESERYALKIAGLGDAPGLRVATWLNDHGLRTGAPVRTEVVGERLVALLEFVDGRSLGTADDDVTLVGETLGRAHGLLVEAPVPAGLDRWPWAWLDPAVIDEPDLRDAAARAIGEAERIAPTTTHGVLHGDPAPEAFLASDAGVALIDWGAACHGPLLFDLASALMYAGPGVLVAYGRTGPLGADELALVPVYLAFRWALQACYFAGRRRRGDLTGIAGEEDNDKGLADARRGLLG
jgi:Ser/Thr protein kinase RdoA (MazF antagonist)